MRRNTNTETIEGYLYECDLKIKKVESKESKNFGKEYIAGTISIATDEECLNVLTIHYTFVTEFTNSGNKNNTFAALKRIYEGGKTVVMDGKENAMKIKASTSAALNDFYPQGQDELISQPKNEGGFITILNQFDVPDKDIGRNKFMFDMLITHVQHIDANPERNIAEDYAEIRGAIFNFKNDLLPFTIIARNPKAIEYFENLGATDKEPIYTMVWGKIVSSTITIAKTTKSAFGEDAVDVTQRKIKEWVVTGAKETAYVFDDESTITKAELEKAVQDRNIMLADVKKRRDDYIKSKGTTVKVDDDATVPVGGFSF